MVEVQRVQATVSAAHKQYVRETKVLEALQRRGVVAEQKHQEAQRTRDAMKEACGLKDAEYFQMRQRADATERQLAAVNRERDMLHQDFMSAEQKTQRNVSWLAEKESQIHHLQHELSAFEEYAQKQRESIYHITKECMRYEEEIKKHAFSCANVMAEVQAREQQIAQAQRTVEDVEAKLKQQQAMLDTVEAERNAYNKHYGQLRHELAEMNKEFQLTLNQIQQLKEELVRRDKSMSTEDGTIETLQRQKKEVEAHISVLKRRAERRKRSAEQFHTEMGKLSEILALATEETARQRRKCRDIMQERDVLYNRTTQRTRELTALYEKIHAQQSLLQRGESAYRERVQHIEQLEYQEAHLSAELARMKEFVSRLPDLRLLINNASRDLQKERVRVSALLDEGQRKVNLHPSHELRWSDPETFELSERVRGLQRELNARRQLLDQREQDIEQREQQYLKAKAAVAKQPGPEVAEQLSAYQASLVKKKGQVAQMQESLRYFREQTDLYRTRHDELRDRLADMAKVYATMRQTDEALAARAANSTADNADAESGANDEDNFVYTGFVAPPLSPGNGEV
ncbi:flagellar associated protein [Strigomonas culicis]|uniref:Flagellar associated protein n=1 Tax=Strigomonas culicis TaxID=28005 RepID=S9UT03_9TRYP|nr:flagellar associated protein [Strigomonas culicis]|eukprot:EPY31944.1 flagellar associated protein [Strigomonas culicis]